MNNFIKDVENALLNNDVSLKEIMRSHLAYLNTLSKRKDTTDY